MAELETGAIVASHYVVVSLLGVGGMGAVYRVRDARTDELRAIKVLRQARGDLATRFVREARIASALAHPNIARVYEVLELDDGTPAIVMELLDGESLGARLARSGKLAPAAIARTCIGVVAAIQAAHDRGVVHRDLKPDNVFLCEDGTVKVLDFGIAKVTFETPDPAITAAALTETGQILGTPQYMAPEQIFGEKDVDARADVWALGVILYQALAGVRPFEGANPGQIFKAIALEPPVPLLERAPETPRELAELVASMLVHARAERLSDLAHVARVLERVVAADLGEAPTLRASDASLVVPNARGPAAKRRGVVALGALVAALVAGAVVVARRSPPQAELPTVEAPRDSPSASSREETAPPSSHLSSARSAGISTGSSARSSIGSPTGPSSPSISSSAPPASKPPLASRPVSIAASSASVARVSADAGAVHKNRSGPLNRDEF